MTFQSVSPSSTAFPLPLFCLLAGLSSAAARAQSSGAGSASSPNSSKAGESSSSAAGFAREKAPSLVDPAGPTISLISAEPVFRDGRGAECLRLRRGPGGERAGAQAGPRRDEPGACQERRRARQARQALPLHCPAPHDGRRARHCAIHLAGALSDAAPGAGDRGRADRDAPRLHAGGRDRAAAARLCRRRGPARHLAGGASHLRRGSRPAARSALQDDRLHQPLSQDARRDLRRAAVCCGDRAACSRRAWSMPASTAPIMWWWFRR